MGLLRSRVPLFRKTKRSFIERFFAFVDHLHHWIVDVEDLYGVGVVGTVVVVVLG